MVEGKLHSIETMGLLDGPGIRTVFFLQGCPLRCAYCHNPDSQNIFSKDLIKKEEVLDIANRYKPYYKNDNGGVTFSGGEPLIQGKFLSETLKLLKDNDFHTVVDTSGYGDERYFKDILKNTDVLILDIKHFDNKGFRELTERSIGRVNKFISYLNDFNGKIWIRHVMVPGITDNTESMYALFNKVSHLVSKIDKFEILPYHRLGVNKYKELDIEYRLENVPEMQKDKAERYEKILNNLLIRNKKLEVKRIV